MDAVKPLPFRFEVCGEPAKLYYVEDGGNREVPIFQCASRIASDIEVALWARLQMAETQLGAMNRVSERTDRSRGKEKPVAAEV